VKIDLEIWMTIDLGVTAAQVGATSKV